MIKVLSAGFYSSIQDLGRYEYQEFGVPISGVMDNYSSKIANALVGNDENAAVLELTLTGPKLEFQKNTIISLSGADMSPKLNEKSVYTNTAIQIAKGDILAFGKLKHGCRCYLAIQGGFQTEKVMQSRSMYKGITTKFRIDNGDELQFNSNKSNKPNSKASIKINSFHFDNNILDVYKGPEFDLLLTTQQESLLNSTFSVANDNSRMGYQLQETLNNKLKPIITSLVLPGTVQLTPSGNLIILMRDCQTTGGYPRVLQLSSNAINRLAQKNRGDKVEFNFLDYNI